MRKAPRCCERETETGIAAYVYYVWAFSDQRSALAQSDTFWNIANNLADCVTYRPLAFMARSPSFVLFPSWALPLSAFQMNILTLSFVCHFILSAFESLFFRPSLCTAIIHTACSQLPRVGPHNIMLKNNLHFTLHCNIIHFARTSIFMRSNWEFKQFEPFYLSCHSI